jgi:hypothetical protein
MGSGYADCWERGCGALKAGLGRVMRRGAIGLMKGQRRYRLMDCCLSTGRLPHIALAFSQASQCLHHTCTHVTPSRTLQPNPLRTPLGRSSSTQMRSSASCALGEVRRTALDHNEP